MQSAKDIESLLRLFPAPSGVRSCLVGGEGNKKNSSGGSRPVNTQQHASMRSEKQRKAEEVEREEPIAQPSQ